jgi:hypothetical protein
MTRVEHQIHSADPSDVRQDAGALSGDARGTQGQAGTVDGRDLPHFKELQVLQGKVAVACANQSR